MITHGQRSCTSLLSASRPISPTDDHQGRHRGGRGPEQSTEVRADHLSFSTATHADLLPRAYVTVGSALPFQRNGYTRYDALIFRLEGE